MPNEDSLNQRVADARGDQPDAGLQDLIAVTHAALELRVRIRMSVLAATQDGRTELAALLQALDRAEARQVAALVSALRRYLEHLDEDASMTRPSA